MSGLILDYSDLLKKRAMDKTATKITHMVGKDNPMGIFPLMESKDGLFSPG